MKSKPNIYKYKYGVWDLTLHLLKLAKEEGYEEGVNTDRGDFIKSSISKMVFIAFSYCIKYDFPVGYDIIFRKNSYGAYSEDIRRKLKPYYSSGVEFSQGEFIKELNEDYPHLNTIFKEILRLESEHMYASARMINNTKIMTDYEEEDSDRLVEVPHRFAQCSIWTKQEILLITLDLDDLLDPSRKGKKLSKKKAKRIHEVDNRIPISDEVEYNAIVKYVQLLDKGFFKTENTLEFNCWELSILRDTPKELIDVVEVFGAYKVDDIE